MLTLPLLAQELSGLRVVPTEELLLHAFEAYLTVAQGQPQDLNEFLLWAPTALRDMSTADSHLVPLDGFYRDLRSWEDLDWSFNTEPLSQGQQRMVHYWAMKGRLHNALVERLSALGIGTAGSVERRAAERPLAPPFQHLWAAGLNALTPAEERMLDHCRRTIGTRFAWDSDAFYLTDPSQEAGEHLRKAIQRFGHGLIPPGERIAKRSCRVEVVRTPNTVSQTWALAELLADTPPDERAETTVVLADTALLAPLLDALPSDLDAVNVTMGLPLAELPAGTLLRAFIAMHRGHVHGRGFLHADTERVLAHPLLQHGDAFALRSVRSSGRTRSTTEELMALLDRPEAGVAFGPCTNAQGMPARVEALLDMARISTQGDALSQGQLFAAARALQRIHRLLGERLLLMDLTTYGSMIDRLLRVAEVGLFGEPLQGIQVMGLLETRAIDARHVIVLGAQEGRLPADTSGASYIPFELRRAYGLPLRDGTDAVQAYNFMRLLHGADRLSLMVADHDDGGGASRFVLQLEQELYAAPDAALSERNVQLPLPAGGGTGIIVAKDEALLDRYRQLMERGLSPSAISTWLRCPLDHYFRQVMHLEETEEGSARIPANVLGEALHTTMEALIGPWTGTEMTPEALRAAADNVPGLLHKALIGKVPASTLEQGQPLLQTGMAERAAKRFLLNEAAVVEAGTRIMPMHFEVDLRAEVPGGTTVLGCPLNIRGRLDRVDRRNGVVHVLDLKTGKVKEEELKLPDLGPEAPLEDRPKALQLLVYAWLYLWTHPEVDHVRAGILPLQRPSMSDGLFLRVGGEDLVHRHQLPAIDALLLRIAADMLDTTTPLRHSPHGKYCHFCAEPLGA